jgi:hypothetical protein
MLRSQLNDAGIALTPEQFRLPCGHNRYSCEPFCRSLSRSPRPFRAMTPRHPSLKVGWVCATLEHVLRQMASRRIGEMKEHHAKTKDPCNQKAW